MNVENQADRQLKLTFPSVSRIKMSVLPILPQHELNTRIHRPSDTIFQSQFL